MDRMNPDSQTNAPTEQLLLKLAQEQNTEQVLAALDSLTNATEITELAEKLEALGLKFELAEVFSQAKTKLDQLSGTSSAAAEIDTSTALQNKDETTKHVRGVEEGIASYLQDFRGNVDKACAKPEETNNFTPLRNALQQESTRDQIFQSLVTLPNLPAGQSAWIREQAKDTALGVTEILWEMVGVGRDFVGLSTSDEQNDAAKLAFDDWQSSIESEFPKAGKLLVEAVSWLQK